MLVIGKTAKAVAREHALECVVGYTILNDVSARDYQMATTQWMMGKTFDTFAPMGPAIVTADEVPDPHALDIQMVINGEVAWSVIGTNDYERVFLPALRQAVARRNDRT